MTFRASVPVMFLGLPTAATAPASGDIDCRLGLDVLQAQAHAAASLRRNSDTMSTALRGSN